MDSHSLPQRPTWLNQLPDHSIFELDEQEYLEWTRLNNSNSNEKPLNQSTLSTSYLSISKGPTSFSSSRFSSSGFGATVQKETFGLDELKEEYQQAYQGLSCMVVHAQDLYVAVGRQIRYSSLADLKKGVENHGRAAAAEYLENKQHKVLKIQHIDFDIRRLIINQDGKLMAIVGDEKIVIAALPKTIKQDPKAVLCKSFVLGEYYHINKGPSKVVKVLWHPLSKGSTHVLVMTQDCLLRMYDVATDIDEPEQVFNVGNRVHTSGSYGLDFDNAAAFCFGSKHSTWGQLTVYGLTQTGDVYMICPVMPGTCLLDASVLDEIRSKMEIEETELDESKELKALKKEWLESLLENAQPHPFSDEVVIVQNPELKYGKVARQGPFLFQPVPIELDDDDNKAYDILCLETEAADVLVMAYSCGKVDVCIAVDRPSARWELERRLRDDGTYADSGMEPDEDDPPVLSVYESIDLGILKVFGVSSSSGPGYGLVDRRLGIMNRPVLVPDAMYGDTFYIYHETGAHCVSIRPWLDELTGIYDAASRGVVTGLDARVSKFYEAKVKSNVGCVVNTRPLKTSPPAPIIGFEVVADAYLEYSLLLLTSSLRLIGLELTPRPKTISAAAATPAPLQNDSKTQNQENQYQNTLTLPMFENQGGLMAMNGLPLQPKVVLPPGVGAAKIVVTEENLQFLGKMVQGIRESLREIYTACDIAQQRVVVQEAEYERQQDKVQKTHEHIKNTVFDKIQQQVTRQDQQVARQKKLMARADELLHKLMESREPELSPAEKGWVQEVAKAERVVKAFDERKHKVLTQYEILKRRMLELQGSLSGSMSASGSRDGIGMAGFDPRKRASIAPPPTRRYGTAQIQTVEGVLNVESQLLDTTMKMLMDVASRLEVLDISKDTLSSLD
ncbi:hypothetical protein BGZ50_006876 [Haplosporangium sp. Z 11]|nr:hypothetical protein BGZ50_006876 [Haplosporangium sp. Z 11]